MIGIYFRKNALLPSGDSVSTIIKETKNYNCCGLLASCVPPETINLVLPEFKKQNLPYGFKVNAFSNIPDDFIISKKTSLQPNKILGTRKYFTPNYFKNFVKSCYDQGATLLGGCCEIKPRHIKSIKNLV